MIREKYNQKVFSRYRSSLNAFDDLVGDGNDNMSLLFYALNNRFLHWLDNDPNIAVSEKEIQFRKRFYKMLQAIGPGVLKCSQVYENRKALNNPDCTEADQPVTLPNVPVIFAANHGFHDDVLATVLSAKRPVYLVWGSLPLLYNTVDGFATALVGCVCVNRKNTSSRKSVLAKALKALECGMSIVYFPEGGWNKTSEQLILPLWKGVYDLSAAARCPVVPIVHYVRDPEVLKKKNIIHTVIDDPINLFDYPRDLALEKLRDTMAAWVYKMMEVYGKSDYISEMEGYSSSAEKWTAHLKERMKGVARYDSTIERLADYRPKQNTDPVEVWQPIADINLITPKISSHIAFANSLIAQAVLNDFQRRF